MSELSSADWSETDASNNAAVPNGWPEGMSPSGVNDSARAMMGALKRSWDRLNFAYTAGGGTTAYTLTPTVALAAYAQEIWTWKMPSACAADATMNISGLGARNIRILTSAGYVNVPGGALPSGAHVMALCNTADSKFDVIGVAIGPTEGSSATFTSTDAGAGTGPLLDLYRNSASPADSDEIGEITFSGEDDGGNTTIYASLSGQIDDQTDTTEDGRLNIKTMIAGTRATRGYVGHGLVMGAATGGDQGTGTVNAVGVYVGGNPVNRPAQTDTLSSTATANFTAISADHTGYEIELINVAPANDGDDFWLRLSGDGGSTYLTGASYQHSRHGSAAGTGADAGSAADSKIVIGAAIGNATGESISGTIRLLYSGTAAFGVKVTFSVTYTATDGTVIHASGGGYFSTGITLGGIRCMMSTGNMASGAIKWRPILI